MVGDATEYRKLAAIMFTDMVGYGVLLQQNEALAVELLESHRQMVRGILPKHGGREVKATGDGFLYEFNSALAAVQCAVQMQAILRDRNATKPVERAVRIRIGIHVGDVVQRDGDLFGDGVNIAAHIEPRAEPGGVCVSEDVARQVENKIAQPLIRSGVVELKNIRQPVAIYNLVLGDYAIDATKPIVHTGRQPAASRGVPPRKQTARLIAATLAAVVLVVLLVVFLQGEKPIPDPTTRPSKAAGRITSLAVKPLDEFSGDTNQAYLSDGMTEALCSALGNISALRVPGRSSVMRYKGAHKSIGEMAKELRVDAVLEGSVQRAGSRILITVQLVEAATDRHLWSTNYERDLSEFFKVQSEVARAVANEIQVRLTPADQDRLSRARAAKSGGAVEAYLQGMHQWWQWSDEGATNALREFGRAISIDPDYAPAHAGIALSHMLGSGSLWPPKDAMPKCRESAQRAIALDPTLADAYGALGWVRLSFEWDWDTAELHFQRAVELNPKSSLALDAYNNFLVARGRFPEAIAVLEQALETDSLSPALHSDLGWTHWLAGHPERAIPHLRQALKIDPDFHQARTWLGWSYLFTGKTNEAIAEFQAMLKLDPQSPWVPARLGYVYGVAGRRAEALKLLADLDLRARKRYVSPSVRVLIHVGLGQNAEALDGLEKAYAAQESWMAWLKVDPVLVPLHKEPRFQTLLKKVGLEK